MIYYNSNPKKGCIGYYNHTGYIGRKMKYSKEFIEAVEQELDPVDPKEFIESETIECNGRFYYEPFFNDLKTEFENGP